MVDSVPVELSLYQRFNRLFYQLSASATKYWYYDYSTITLARPAGGKPRPHRVRRKNPHRLRGQRQPVGFHCAGINQRVYVDTVNAAGQQRDSTGWNIGVGATLALGPKSTLEGSVGSTSQTYTATGTSTSATTFSLSGTWNGYEPLILRPVLMRTINELALSNYQNYVSTVAGIDFTYDIHYPWKAVGGFSYNTADYTPAPGVAGVNPRTDYFRQGVVRACSTRFVRSTRSARCTNTAKAGRPTSRPAGRNTAATFSPFAWLPDGDVVRFRIAIFHRLLAALRCGLALPAIALSLGLAACDPQPPMTANTLQQPSQMTQTLRMAEYRVAPGDRVRVIVLSDPELSGEYEIDSAGMISPRMAGRIQVVGMTTAEIEELLRTRYRTDGLLRVARLSVDLVAASSFLHPG